MKLNSNQFTAQIGDLAQLIDPQGNKHLVQLVDGGNFQTNHGQLLYQDLIGLPWGSQVSSHLDKVFLMRKPSINDILLNTKRATTIMYPKDIGFILLNLEINNGKTVIEAGTGSGGLTTALCWAVGPDGHVFSYDVRDDVQALARKNVARLNFQDRVTFTTKDIGYGFDENNIDSVFLDVPNPEDYLTSVSEALKPGGFFGSLVPTNNQVIRLLDSLQDHGFKSIEICEILLRYYKPIPARLRPDDRMTAHTGFLIFASPIHKYRI
jgi:tRNA (adenine57-N1/adenine58-N1)-methyltransferase